MKKYSTLSLILCLFNVSAFCASGFFGDCPAFTTLGGTFYELGSCSQAGAPFPANLGTVSSLDLTSGQIQTFENGGDDVNAGNLTYSISGTATSGSIALNDLQLLGGGDERRSASFNIDLLNGLNPGQTYTLVLSYNAPFTFSNSGGSGSGTHQGGNFQTTFTVDPALPVSYSSFEVGSNDSKLTWATTTEINNSHFNIQRSPNGETWKTIGLVKGAGTTDEPQSYIFKDENPYPGINYYRLEQVDFDGTTAYSWVVSTEIKGDFTVIPNPSAEGEMTQLFFAEVAPAGSRLNILDVSGRSVFEQSVEEQSLLEIALPELPSGIYFARLTLPDGAIGAQGKIIKK